MLHNRLFLAAAVLGGALWFGSANTAQAAPPPRMPVIVNRPATPAYRPVVNPVNNRMPGWDWWRTYPWSPYNAYRNPYWYYPYTPYVTPSYYYGVPNSYYNGYYNGSNYLPPVPMPPMPSVN